MNAIATFCAKIAVRQPFNAAAGKINNSSLNFRAPQQCLRLQLSPATYVRGAFQIRLPAPVRFY
jgi:hypothetical protein